MQKEVKVKAWVLNFHEIKFKLINLGCSFSKPLIQKELFEFLGKLGIKKEN